MARKVFFSFHYKPDNWRVSTVRNIGAIEGNKAAKDNDWETITKGGDKQIEKWIAEQMNGRSCIVVLIGKETADRKWINHEIIEAWNNNKGIVGIYIHKLKDSDGNQTVKGENPFDFVNFKDGRKLSSVVKAYNPPFLNSKEVYEYISDNIEKWIEEAIEIRKNN